MHVLRLVDHLSSLSSHRPPVSPARDLSRPPPGPHSMQSGIRGRKGCPPTKCSCHASPGRSNTSLAVSIIEHRCLLPAAPQAAILAMPDVVFSSLPSSLPSFSPSHRPSVPSLLLPPWKTFTVPDSPPPSLP
ncbi:hypothetical protein Mapa_000414 [Marchantia paleacea]|nr:hypothetical protein Mapa_000414 [Marchantia paleacea]